MDTLPFLLVEEAIKRNKATVKLQEFLAHMVSERSRIEQIYINSLNDWATHVYQKTSEFQNETLFQTVNALLPKEAEMSALVHKKLYSMLSAESGPYSCLSENTGLHISTSSYGGCRGVVDVEDEFHKYNVKRINIENDIRRKKENIEENKCLIVGIEEKLAHRSRLANNRKSAKGPRKVDEAMFRLSDLRKKVDLETKNKQQGDRDLMTLLEERRIPMDKMFQELKTLESKRLSLIVHQIKEFNKTMMSNYTLEESETRRRSLNTIIRTAEDVSIDTMLDLEWQEVESKAKARKIGALYKLQDFMSKPLKPLVPAGLEACREGQQRTPVLKRKEPNKCITPCVTPPVTPLDTALSISSVLKDAKTTETSSQRGTSSRSVFTRSNRVSPISVLSDQSVADDDSFIEPRIQPPSSIASSSKSSSACSLETIYLPDDASTRNHLPPPFPVRNFCVTPASDEQEDEESDYQPYATTQVIPFNQAFPTKYCDIPVPPREPKSPVRQRTRNIKYTRNIYDEEEDGEHDDHTDDDSGDCDDGRQSDESELYGAMSEECMIPTSAGLLRNVSVVAQHDFTARNSDQLSFKRGQVIKQKLGENEEGYAYGWVKDAPMAPRRHGWYPSGLVMLK